MKYQHAIAGFALGTVLLLVGCAPDGSLSDGTIPAEAGQIKAVPGETSSAVSTAPHISIDDPISGTGAVVGYLPGGYLLVSGFTETGESTFRDMGTSFGPRNERGKPYTVYRLDGSLVLWGSPDSFQRIAPDPRHEAGQDLKLWASVLVVNGMTESTESVGIDPATGKAIGPYDPYDGAWVDPDPFPVMIDSGYDGILRAHGSDGTELWSLPLESGVQKDFSRSHVAVLLPESRRLMILDIQTGEQVAVLDIAALASGQDVQARLLGEDMVAVSSWDGGQTPRFSMFNF